MSLNKKSLQITTRNLKLSRELSMEDTNNYHGGVSVSVPFRWESEPGTPKIMFKENPLPPLTPPPSYYSQKTPSRSSKKSSMSHILDIWPKRGNRKSVKSSGVPSSPVFSYSSSSSSGSSFSTPASPVGPLKFQRRSQDFDKDGGISSLCFGGGANPRFRGCYASMIKVLLRWEELWLMKEKILQQIWGYKVVFYIIIIIYEGCFCILIWSLWGEIPRPNLLW